MLGDRKSNTTWEQTRPPNNHPVIWMLGLNPLPFDTHTCHSYLWVRRCMHGMFPHSQRFTKISYMLIMRKCVCIKVDMGVGVCLYKNYTYFGRSTHTCVRCRCSAHIYTRLWIYVLCIYICMYWDEMFVHQRWDLITIQFQSAYISNVKKWMVLLNR